MVIARSLFRASGLKRVWTKLAPQQPYEDAFHEALIAAVLPGDCVWDVGANVGLYSLSFSDLVGPRGCVVCFEPSKPNLRVLRRAVENRSNVLIKDVALGRERRRAAIVQGADDRGATSQIVFNSDGGHDVALIERADALTEAGAIPMPNVVKIDTEGFELEVLEGLGQLLKSSTLRTICIEVHFELLEKRGTPNAPSTIERLLSDAGYRVHWTDWSHIVATKQE